MCLRMDLALALGDQRRHELPEHDCREASLPCDMGSDPFVDSELDIASLAFTGVFWQIV